MGDVVVLVVEDDDLVRRAVTDVLDDAGLHVIVAESSARALELARAMARVDVLVTDLHLPDANGRALVRAVAQLHPDAGAVVMSGVDDHAGPLLRKPFTPDELVAAVNGAARRAACKFPPGDK